VTAALVLLVGMVMFFGSSSFLNKSTRFILFFDQSVNGLNEGSLVKFRGVPVGSVQRILIRAEGQHPDSTAIPVIIRIDQTRLQNDLGVVDEAFDPQFIQKAIDNGLVAELSLESFITGQLFVEFSFDRERSPGQQWNLIEENGLIEIPTLSSSLDEITADIAQMISDFSEIDIAELNENINAVLVNTAAVLEGIQSEEISQSIVTAANGVSDLLASDAFADTVQSLETALNSFSSTVETYNLENGPLADTVNVWTAQFSQTLGHLNRLSEQAGLLLEPDSSMRFETEKTLRALRRAAESVRVLADYLERNPSALLTGRPESED